jgi:hypothetical protein
MMQIFPRWAKMSSTIEAYKQMMQNYSIRSYISVFLYHLSRALIFHICPFGQSQPLKCTTIKVCKNTKGCIIRCFLCESRNKECRSRKDTWKGKRWEDPIRKEGSQGGQVSLSVSFLIVHWFLPMININQTIYTQGPPSASLCSQNATSISISPLSQTILGLSRLKCSNHDFETWQCWRRACNCSHLESYKM